MADEQQSGQAENQGQKQPQDEPQAQQATLDQLLQGRDTTLCRSNGTKTNV